MRPAAALPPASPPPPEPPLPTAEGDASVLALLETIREAQRQKLRREALFWGLFSLIVLGVLGLCVAPLSAWAGRVALSLALLSPPFFWLQIARRSVERRVGDRLRTARWLGERLPELSLSLLGAAELEGELGRQPDFSLGLARAHLKALASWARSIDVSRALDERPLRRARRSLWAALALGAAGAVLFAPRFAQGWRALWPKAPQVTAQDRAPITGEVELTYRYPAYTGLAPRTVQGSNGEVSAPAGTEVVVRTRSDRTVARAGLVLNGQAISLKVQGGRELAGSFVLKESGSYRFVFFSTGGRVVAEGPELSVQIEADAAPTVALLTPAQEIEVRSDERLTLKYEAQDDYGLSELNLVYQRRGAEKRIRLPLEDRRRVAAQYVWDLKLLDFEEGERIPYVLEAKDNDTVAGPQRGTSRSHVLKVYSAAEHQKEALERVEVLWDRLVRQLADRMEGPDRAQPKAPAAVAASAHIDEAGWSLVRDLLETGSDLRREKDAPLGLAPGLIHVSEEIRERLRDTTEARRDYLREVHGNLHALGGERLTRAAQEEVDEMERDVLYLESLLQKHKVAALKTLARKLANERRQLAASLQEFRKSKDPQAQKALLEQIQALRRHMAELTQQMAELSKGLGDEHLSPEAMAADFKDLGGELDKLEELVKQGKADEALAQLQKLTLEMGEMERNLERSSGGEVDPQLTAELQSFRKELDETTDAQKKLAERTKALRDRYREQRRQHLAQRAQKLKEQLLRETDALAKEYRELPPHAVGYPQDSGRAQDDARSELENLLGALKADDFDLAAEAAERMRRSAQALQMMGELQEQRDIYMNSPPEAQAQTREMARRLEKDAQKAHEIERQLSQLFPPSGQLMSESDRQALRQMAQSQRDLEKRAGGLRQRMRQLQQRAPIFGQDAQEQMRAIGSQMGDAEQQLESQEPGRAHSEQRQALEGLQQFAERLDQAQKGGGQGGMPLPMSDRESGSGGPEEGLRDLSRERVEIPDADDSKAPREFRKDLLEAMKQGVPERYRDQVKRYYEELVK